MQLIRTYFLTLNYFYTQKKLGAPWQHGPISDINNMFEKASKVLRIERGIKVGNLRTEFPGVVIKGIIVAAEAAGFNIFSKFAHVATHAWSSFDGWARKIQFAHADTHQPL